MSFPEPKPGLVVRYDYLWTHEATRGQDQGKDRPACLVAASDSMLRPRYVVFLPITHTPPSGDTVGIEIPAKVKAEFITLARQKKSAAVRRRPWKSEDECPVPQGWGHEDLSRPA